MIGIRINGITLKTVFSNILPGDQSKRTFHVVYFSGTVSNIDEAVTWLTYTYYYTRATQNPIAYGLPHMILDKVRRRLVL